MAIKDWPGGVISKTPVVPTSSGASGVWTLDQVAYWAKQGAWPYGLPDPYYEYVSLLLTGNGTNGAQNNTFLDSSSNNFTITRNGNTTQGTFSPYGSLWSNYFDGSGDYLSAASNAAFGVGTGDFTIEAWIYTADTSFMIGCCTATGGVGLGYNIDNGSQGLWLGRVGQGPDATSGVQLTYSTWTHVAVSRSGTSVKFFVNGTQSGSTQTVSTNYATGAFKVGADVSASFDYAGYISNFRLVKGTALYTSNFTPSTTPLTAVSGTSLLTCQSNRFIDNSSNNFTLTVNGNTSVQRFSPFNPTSAYSAATIGGSGYFDGSGDWLSVSTASASGDLTMEFWVYPTTSISSGNYGLFAASDQRFGMITVSGNLYFLAASDINTSTPLPINTWSHVAISKNSGTIRIFLNGVQIASASNSNTATGNWRIASNQSGEIFPACYMSDVRYIVGTGLYTTAFTPPTAPLTAITNTSLLCNFTNAGIPDAAMMNDLETVGNAQVSTSVKKYGTGSLYFDGADDCLLARSGTPPLALGSGDFTIEAWVYPTSLATYDTIYDSRIGDSGTGIAVLLNSSGNVVLYYSAAVQFTSSSTVSANTWTHIAVVRSGTTITVYINGSSVGTKTSVTTNFSDANAVVGRVNDVATHFFNGYIDDLRTTKGYARYTANFTPPTAAFPTF